MLEELEIRDFALIEHVKVRWAAGLNVLTGETGAGKSIIIDALNTVLGGRAGASVIRAGAERALIEATFTENPEIAGWLKEKELGSQDFAALVVSREISKTGTRARINGTLVNVALLQELRDKLISFHAQHEARTLLSCQSQLEMLDGLGDRTHEKLRGRVGTLYARTKELRRQLEEMQLSEEERLRKLDFLRFQLRELEDAALTDPDEDECVEAQCRVLDNVAQLEECALSACAALTGAEEPGAASALDQLETALSSLETAACLDTQLAPHVEALRAAQQSIEDVSRAVRRYRDSLDSDPDTLVSLKARLSQLATVKRKYGPRLADAIARQSELAQEIDRLENMAQAAGQLEAESAGATAELGKLAADLSSRRQKLAASFAGAVQAELADLAMERCCFAVDFDKTEPGPHGADRIEFVLSPNPGQPPAPLAKIASGGELSRVMLAIKSIVAQADRVPIVVFDEIDTGVSGRALQSIREKLARLARSHQILCVTHQPMIASLAANHVQVTKEQSDSATHVRVATLEGEARIAAIADMAGGQADQAESLRFARALCQQGVQLRSS
ncbi:MAG TPA: DNA repair protein RecN [Candidatus Obscuribacterales bacterium]